MNKTLLDLSELTDEIFTEIPILQERIQNILEADHDVARQGLQEVLKFLLLISETNKKLTPSQKVDLIWHEFILCTRIYNEVCHTHFGRFIHHHPGGTNEENRRQYKNTLKTYSDNFGEPPYFFWGTEQNFENCGSCDAN